MSNSSITYRNWFKILKNSNYIRRRNEKLEKILFKFYLNCRELLKKFKKFETENKISKEIIRAY